MKFGVVVCPTCKNAVGINLKVKSTKCRRCNQQFKVKNRKILYETNSERELALAVGQVNLKILNGTNDYQNLLNDLEIENRQELFEQDGIFAFDQSIDNFKRIAMKVKKFNTLQDQLVGLAVELSKEFTVFSAGDFGKVIVHLGLNPDESEKYIEQLISSGLIYEPRVGYYRILKE
jgi:hypothetical protein